MPIFEFRCSACGHLEEVLQKHTDPAPDACPRCGVAKTMGKELSVSAFHLKGGGWYKDLYASSSTTTPAADGGDNKADSKDAGKDTKADAPKSESKTESKTDKPAATTTTTAAPAAAAPAAAAPAPKPAAA